jgi:hypothetical protein
VRAADKPYTNACCPTGHSCERQSSSMWRCAPTGVLESLGGACTGPKVLALNTLCGGKNLCGVDQLCPGKCCEAGTYCLRSSRYTWSCALTAPFPG